MGVIDRWRKAARPASNEAGADTAVVSGGEQSGAEESDAPESPVRPVAPPQLPPPLGGGSAIATTAPSTDPVAVAPPEAEAIAAAYAMPASSSPAGGDGAAPDLPAAGAGTPRVSAGVSPNGAAAGADTRGWPEQLQPVDEASSATSGDCGERHGGGQPLVIQADAPLVDGLRALLVHHLKRSVGTSVVSLSTSQAELLEHHLARLSSYAQKIVHTLAFATRFLSKQQFEGDSGELEGPDAHAGNGFSAGGVRVSASPFSGSEGMPQSQMAANGGDPMAASQAAGAAAATAAKPPRKSLKLNDDEILMLYRSAQKEAAIEADWRGIQGPTPSRVGAHGNDGTYSSRSGASGYGPSQHSPGSRDDYEGSGSRAEYLRILSRAMQEPGRSPRAVAAEIADPTKKTICCSGRAPAVIDYGFLGDDGRSQPSQPAQGSGRRP